MSRRLPTVVVASFLAMVVGCSGRDEALVRRQTADMKKGLASAPADVRRDRDRATLWKTMRDLYASRGYEPIWIDGTHPTKRFDSLVAALQEMRTHGIDPERYDVAALTAARAGTTRGWFRSGKGLDEHAVVPLDIKATWAWVRGAADLSAGAADIEGPADKLWRLRRQKIDFQKELASAIDGGSPEDQFQKLAPTHAEYLRLKDAYTNYVAIAEAGGWKSLPATLALKKGDRSPHLPALAERLQITGDLAAGEASETREIFDDELSAAVAHFQRRHGLEPDGVLGRQVVAEMNVPVASRIRQLELNLERWRWLPRDLGERYIFVNVPEYRLEVHEGERIPLRMNVITGAKGTPTPIFRDTMTHIVFSPYWNVPDGIAAGETLPAVQSDPSFLDRNRIEVVGTSGTVVDPATVDWSSATDDGAFPYRFRQRPGSSNSLGLVKFVFPNEHDVYLHDTPADSLFTRAYRALSHGCVRLEQPQALAEYLLKDQPEWTPERITAAMHAGEEKHVKLSRPVPVHLLYWTARVSEDGVVHFRQDVYGRDMRELGNLMARQ
ncbi:MAG: L,D-transpeptidase family protein [Vicinamibacterales bacterium]